MNLTKKELSILGCLWKKSPLSCVEISGFSDFSENAIYISVNHLIAKGYVRVSSTKVGVRKPIKLFVPTITKADYLASLITSSPIYEDEILPSFFQRLIARVKRQETLDELQAILDQARSKLL